MAIKVATEASESTTDKGRILEDLVRSVLKIQDFDVVGEVQFTGMELDLLAKHNQNGKQIYVECKALSDDARVQADVIKSLIGTCTIKEYEEAWLISTTELGKQAKGLVEEMSTRPNSKKYFFYAPSDLIRLLIGAKIITPTDHPRAVLSEFLKSDASIGEPDLIISSRGYYWAFPIIRSGVAQGYIFSNPRHEGFISDNALLEFFEDARIYPQEINLREIFSVEIGQGLFPASCPDILNLNPAYIESTNQLGMRIDHPNKGALTLRDIFIYPTLELTENEDKDRVNSERLLQLDEQFCNCIIFGEELSGKTALAHNLQKGIALRGFIPIYLSAKDIKSADPDKLTALLKKEFKRQYLDNAAYTTCFSDTLDKDPKRVKIIIDDFEELAIKRSEAKTKFIKYLSETFGASIFFASRNLEITLMADSAAREQLTGFLPLKILQMGYVLREKLIEKWLTVEIGDSLTDAEIHNRTVEVSGKVALAVGTNFVPTYPIFLITILQLIETASKTNLQGSSYADLYSYLITNSLGNAGAKPEDLDFYLTYLSFLAQHLFTSNKRSLSSPELKTVFGSYCEKMEIKKNFDQVHSLLNKAQVLRREDELYSFGHNYSYYFFVAKYLSDHSEEKTTQVLVDSLIEHLYRAEYANVVLFLIHHSKSKELVKKVLNEAKNLHGDLLAFKLTDEQTEKINKMIQGELNFEITDEKPREVRQKQLEQKDANNKQETAEQLETAQGKSELDVIGQINLGFKLIQLMGQITTNYYGSLDGSQKSELIEEIHALGFKGLMKLMQDLDVFGEALKFEVRRRAELKGSATADQVDAVADQIVYAFTQMISLSFVKRIGDSITSKNIFPSLDKYMQADGSPAAKLVNIAAKLNFPEGIDAGAILGLDAEFEKNSLGRRLLRMLVIDHMYKFDVPIDVKQSICKKLGIKLIQKRLN